MAATLRADVSVAPSTPIGEGSGAASARAYHSALAYLRAFLVVLVVAHHSAIAYIDGLTSFPESLLIKPPLWRPFPVIDPRADWACFDLFTGFNDDFFMSLMFLVLGLFVWSSLRRKGNAPAIPRTQAGRDQTSTISRKATPAHPARKVQLISEGHLAFSTVTDSGIILGFTDCILEWRMRNVSRET